MRENFLQELVPLSEATAVAHHVVAAGGRSLRGEALVQVRRQAALAFGAFARILIRWDGSVRVATLYEMAQLLADAHTESAQQEVLSSLYIRRIDLISVLDRFEAASRRGAEELDGVPLPDAWRHPDRLARESEALPDTSREVCAQSRRLVETSRALRHKA